MSTGTAGGATHACHELLVELGGRLPDELLWRLRDWLAAESGPAVSAETRVAREMVSVMLPRELLRRRMGLTDRERDLLSEAAGDWGSARRLLDAVLPVHVPSEPPYRFEVDHAVDPAALSVLAVVRGHPGCRELSMARRTDGRGGQRVVLVRGGDRPWALAATLQRVLRAHGDRTPCVEVISAETEPSFYHRAAAAAAITLWRAEDVHTDEFVGAHS